MYICPPAATSTQHDVFAMLDEIRREWFDWFVRVAQDSFRRRGGEGRPPYRASLSLSAHLQCLLPSRAAGE